MVADLRLAIADIIRGGAQHRTEAKIKGDRRPSVMPAPPLTPRRCASSDGKSSRRTLSARP